MRPHAAVFAGAVVLALALGACGGDGSDDDTGVTAGRADDPVTSVTVTSPDLSFDIGTIYVPTGEEVALTYDNQHEGIAHNVHVLHKAADGEDPKSSIEIGPDTRTITFIMEEAGEYSYICDVHPQMRGTLVVVE